MGLMGGLLMADYGGLWRILSGLTRSTDRPSWTGACQDQCISTKGLRVSV